MKCAVLFLSIASLAIAVPAIADARPDGKGQRAERRERVRGDEGRPGRGMRERPARETPPPDYRPRRDSLGSGWRQQQDEVRTGVRQRGFVPLNRVIPNLHRRFPGRQLDAGLEQGWQGQPVYRVRWATQSGRRIDVIVDAQTGAILEVEGQ